MQWQSCVLMLKQDLVLTLQLKDYSLKLCFLEHGSFLDPACTGFLNIPDPTGKHSYCSHQNRRLQWNLCLLPSHGENMLYHCEALTILTPVRTQPRISVPGSIHIYVEPLFVSTIIDIIHFPATFSPLVGSLYSLTG